MSETDLALATDLAVRAGKLLVDLRVTARNEGWDAGQLKARGDYDSNRLLLDELRAARPDDGILSEEAVDDHHRLTCQRVWIVDPLDGTREFSELDRDDWAVHVALCVAGRADVGVVYLPARDELFDGTPTARTASVDVPRIVVSRTRPPAEAQRIADALGGALIAMGSAGAKTAAVLRGDADLYVHSGGQFEWDLAAPVAAALGAGLHATRIDGGAFSFNHANPYLPDALIGDPALAVRALAVLADTQ